MRSLIVIALTACALGFLGTARADDAPPAPKSKADQLFDEGVDLRSKGAFKEACAKFEEAMRHDERAIGTLLNLALCAEKFGKIATAVHLYAEARDRAREQGLAEHQKAAEEHIAALSPQIAHLTITLTETQPGTKLVIDDQVVALDKLVDLPLDSGKRTISVSAPGRLSYETTTVMVAGQTVVVTIPVLAKSVTVKSSRASIGKVVTIGGAVAIATGVVLGVYAKSRYDAQFDPHLDAAGKSYLPCHRDGNGDAVCDMGGQPETENARRFGVVGTVVGTVGFAAVGVGLYLWLLAPADAPTVDRNVRVVPTVAPDQVGLTAIGRF